MAFKPGLSGNPAGRPRKGRALTELLRAAGGRTRLDITGTELPARELLARRIWDAALSGQIQLDDKWIRVEDFYQWFELVKWLYAQVDGPVSPAPEDGAVQRRFADDLLERVAAHAYDSDTAPV